MNLRKLKLRNKAKNAAHHKDNFYTAKFLLENYYLEECAYFWQVVDRYRQKFNITQVF